MANFPGRNMEQSFYEDSRPWRDNIAGWIMVIIAAILVVVGLVSNFGGVNMDHPQTNPAAVEQLV